MGIINDLNYILKTKQDLRQALIEKGAQIEEDATFRSYVDAINNLEISTSGGYASLTYHNALINYATTSPITALTLNVAEIIGGVEQTPVQYVGTYIQDNEAKILDANGFNIYMGSSIVFDSILEIGKTYKISTASYSTSTNKFFYATVFNDAEIHTYRDYDANNIIHEQSYNGFSYNETLTVTKDVVRYVTASLEK